MISLEQQFVELCAKNIRKHPECYKKSVQQDPEGHALRLIVGLNKAEIAQLINAEHEEQRELAKHGY